METKWICKDSGVLTAMRRDYNGVLRKFTISVSAEWDPNVEDAPDAEVAEVAEEIAAHLNEVIDS